MTFWSTSTGEDLAKTPVQAGEYETPSTNMDPIPDGSTVLAYIKEAKWDTGKPEDGSPRFINLRWDVMEPEAVKNRVIFQKIWAKDPDPQAKKPDDKRDKALKMLAAIDANAGGKLAAKGAEPTNDELLVALANKPMAITVKVWSMTGNDGSTMEGNWVCAVAPKGKELVVKDAPKKPASGGGANYDDLDDDIPF